MREIDFMAVGDSHGDAICVRYGPSATEFVVDIIDGGYTAVGEDIISHVHHVYGTGRVENVILTHADDDHARGLIPVVQSLDIGALRMNRPWLWVDNFIQHHHGNYTRQGLIDDIKDKHRYLVELEEIATWRGIPVHDVFQGSRYGAFTVLAPSRERYIALLPHIDKLPETYGLGAAPSIFDRARDFIANIAERWDYETLQANPPATSASNETSVVQLFSHDNYRALFTADVGPQGLAEAYLYGQSIRMASKPNLLQIPHQGSRRNVTPVVLDAWCGERTTDRTIDRGRAFCMVGEGKTDHPRRIVTNAFTRRGYRVQVGRGSTSLYSDTPRDGWNKTCDVEPFHDSVEDYT